MIDFKNGTVIKLKQVSNERSEVVEGLLTQGEQVISTYQALRDKVIFTNKRIIAINSQGLIGKKKDFTSLPYSKINVFSVETAGFGIDDSELELYFSGLGKVEFDFKGKSDIKEIGRMISEYTLR